MSPEVRCVIYALLAAVGVWDVVSGEPALAIVSIVALGVVAVSYAWSER